MIYSLLCQYMMKILICDPDYAPVVAFIRTSLLIKIRGWQKNGAKITLICSSEAKEFYQKMLPGVEIFTFPFSWKGKTRWAVPFEFLRANFLLMPYLFKVKGRFDIIYSFSSTLEIVFFAFVLKLIDRKVRWFVVVDNIVPKPNERPGNYILKTLPYLAFLISNKLIKIADGIFVVTKMLKDYYEKKGIKVIKTGTGNGLDIDSFKEEIPSNFPRFNALFGGRIHPAKGIFDLVKIIKEIVRYDKNYTLGIMGDGEEYMKQKLKKEIKRNNLSNNILLLGHKNTKERWDLYRNSDFFLFPSYAEGCPQVVLEAFAANKLVIAYDLPEYRDAFKKYIKYGELIIFNKGDTAKIIKYILSIKGKKFNFHNKLSDFSWDKIVSTEWKAFCQGVK